MQRPHVVFPEVKRLKYDKITGMIQTKCAVGERVTAARHVPGNNSSPIFGFFLNCTSAFDIPAPETDSAPDATGKQEFRGMQCADDDAGVYSTSWTSVEEEVVQISDASKRNVSPPPPAARYPERYDIKPQAGVITAKISLLIKCVAKCMTSLV